MTHAIARIEYPKAPNGLTLPLRNSLALQDLAKHRAVIAVELEVLAKKMDRFGWERDRNSPAHDRLVIDWMDALQDYPLDEIRAACREAVNARPNVMPNEGHILVEITKARAAYVRSIPKQQEPERPRERLTAERRAQIMAEVNLSEVGFSPKRMDQA